MGSGETGPAIGFYLDFGELLQSHIMEDTICLTLVLQDFVDSVEK